MFNGALLCAHVCCRSINKRTSTWAELGVLREELEKYQPGTNDQGCIVVTNKVDLSASDGDPAAEIEKAKTKLKELESYVKTKMVLQMGDGFMSLPLRPRANVVALMEAYVYILIILRRDSGLMPRRMISTLASI
jgi:GTPase involved in cell partitioning and DNA repair